MLTACLVLLGGELVLRILKRHRRDPRVDSGVPKSINEVGHRVGLEAAGQPGLS